MKRIISLIIVTSFLLTSCGKIITDESTNENLNSTEETCATVTIYESIETEPTEIVVPIDTASEALQITNDSESTTGSKLSLLDEPSYDEYEATDPELYQIICDNLYSELDASFLEDDYSIDSISISYLTSEYIKELEFNNQKNDYFGYKLEDLDKQFEGKRYVFTTDDNGKTVPKEFEKYDETYDIALRKVAVGTAVILVCVVVSIVLPEIAVSAGATAAASTCSKVAFVFSGMASSGAKMAAGGALFGAVSGGVLTGLRTGDVKEATKSAIKEAADGYLWGAVTGIFAGGSKGFKTLNTKVLSPRDAEKAALKVYGGMEQQAFFEGENITNKYRPKGTTIPDIVRENNGGLEAIEVKRYNLDAPGRLDSLLNELNRQIGSRKVNLPRGSTQRIVLDVTGRNYSKGFIETVIKFLQDGLYKTYGGTIPIDYIGQVF